MKTDPQAMLAKAEADRSAAADRLVQLRDRRASSLLDEGLGAIERIDTDVAVVQRTISILDDRIGALKIELAKQRLAQRERLRSDAIAAIEERLRAKDEAAVDLERAIAQLGAAFNVYRSHVSDVFTGWDEALLGPANLFCQPDAMAVQICSALGAHSGASSVRLSEIAERVGPVGEHAAKASEAILAALRGSPLPADLEAA